jgi:hypothetical protein
MFYYFDESGDFAVPKVPTIHKVAIVVGIAISDVIYDDLHKAYCQFVKKLGPSECVNGEPKGTLLSYEHKKEVCNLLANYDGVSLTPVTLDLSSLVHSNICSMPDRMARVLCKWADKMCCPEAREQTLLLARQCANLSVNQSLRIYSLANCIREALHHAVLFLSTRGHATAWKNLRFEIDRVQTKPNSREETVFSEMVLGWLMGWSRTKPLMTIEEIHTADHPFIKNYCTTGGVDLGKMLYGNLQWVDSRNSWGVQLADISATIVYQAASTLNDESGSISLYRLLMRKSAYGWRRGPGLFIPLQGLSTFVSRKYVILSEAMKRSRSARSEGYGSGIFNPDKRSPAT